MFFFAMKGKNMKKIITIDGKEYEMQSSAYTQFAYKDLTGRSLLDDLKKLVKLEINDEMDLSILDELTIPLLDMSYVMIQEASANQYKTKEEFIKSINSLYDDIAWISEVIILACTPISRQLQNKV